MKVQVVTEPEGSVPKSGIFKKVFLAFTFVFSIIAISSISYMLGQRSRVLSDPNNLRSPNLENKNVPVTTSQIVEKEKSTIVESTRSGTLRTKILNPETNLDGYRASDFSGTSTNEIRTGRNEISVARGFVSFDITDIPPSAQIEEATIRLYQAKIVRNPYAEGGIIKLDHLTLGDSLDVVDYSSPALSSGFAILSSSKAVEWKEAKVTERVKDDVANARVSSQFRIHFQIENSGGTAEGDLVLFESSEDALGTENIPQLVVKYY